MKYILIYYAKESGVKSTQMNLNFSINNLNLKRVEWKLAEQLNLDKVTILSYKKVTK